MGQIVTTKAHADRCNLQAIQAGGSKADYVLALNEVWLVDTTNADKGENGYGRYDSYIVGDGVTEACNLEVMKIDDVPEKQIVVVRYKSTSEVVQTDGNVGDLWIQGNLLKVCTVAKHEDEGHEVYAEYEAVTPDASKLYMYNNVLYRYVNNAFVQVGEQGPQGEKGDTGDTGPQGPKGADAVVLDGVSLADSKKAAITAENPSGTVPTARAVTELDQAITKRSIASEVSTLNVSGTFGAVCKTGLFINASGTIAVPTGTVAKYYLYYAQEMLPMGSVVHFQRNCSTARMARWACVRELPTDESVVEGASTDLLLAYSGTEHSYDITMPYDGYLLWYWYNDSWTSGTYRMEWWRGDGWMQMRSDIDAMLAENSPMSDNGGYPVSDLDIADEYGNVLMRLSEGHVKTKNFDSASLDTGFNPYKRLTRFAVTVDTGRPIADGYTATGRTTADMKSPSYDTDNAALYLPVTYDPAGKPTRLVMFGKQGGSFVTSGNDPLFGANYLNIAPFLLSLGYALLVVDGTPDGWAASLITSGNGSLDGYQNGNYIAVQSARRAYDYVIKNYNIDRGGVFGFGYSQGGWMIQNIAELSGIPFLAVALKSPLLSLKSHWNSSSKYYRSDGTTVVNNHKFRYLMTKVWGIADELGVADGVAVTDAWLESLDYEQWKWMWAGYDPFTRYAIDVEENPSTAVEDIDSVTMMRTCRFPVKIWVAKDDNVVGSSIPCVWIKALRNAGCAADIHVYNASQSHHLQPSLWSAVGTFEENGVTRNVYPPTLEMALWFYQYGGQPVVYDTEEPVVPGEDDDEDDEG